MRVRAHEARPHPANEVRQRPDARFGAGEQIQIEDKTWLHRADLAGRIAHDEIALLEIFVDRVLDEFVVSAVLCLEAESALPMPRLHHLAARNDLNATGLSAVAAFAENYAAVTVAFDEEVVVRMLLAL